MFCSFFRRWCIRIYHQDLTDFCDTGILLVKNGGIVSINRSGSELLELASEPSDDHPVLLETILPDEAFEKINSLLQSSSENGDTLSTEVCLVKDKGQRYYRVSARCLPDTRGTAFFWVDITQEIFTRQVLQDREDGFQHLQQRVPVGMLRFMADGHLVTINSAFVKMLGYSDEQEFYTVPIEKVWLDLNQRAQLLQMIAIQGNTADYQAQLIKSNGESVWVSINAVSEYDETGHLKWFDAVVLDISAQKVIEGEVESYRSQMRELVDKRTRELSCANAKLIQEIGERHRAEAIQTVIYQIAQAVNVQQSLTELLSIVQRELGKLVNTSNFFVALYNNDTGNYSFPFVVDEMESSEEWSIPLNLDGSLTDLVRKTGKAILHDEEPSGGTVSVHDIRIIGPDCKVWLGVPLRISTGVTGVMVIQDYHSVSTITEKDLELLSMVSENVATAIESFQTRKVIQERETLYRTVTEALAEGLVITGPDFRITHINPAAKAILGDIIGHRLHDLVCKEDAEVLMKALSQLEKELCSRIELTMRVHDGAFKEMGVSLSPLLKKQDTLIGSVVLIRDLTERRKAEAERFKLEQQVLHTQKLESLGILAGGIAHDFNNLLSAILGNAELAADKLPEYSGVPALIEEIIKGTKRAAGLSRQMLAYAGRSSFLKTPLKLNPLISEMGALLRVSVSRRITLNFQLGENLPQIMGDPAQISQVIMNLITNAAEAIGEDMSGTVTVRTSLMTCNSEYLAETFLSNNLAEGNYLKIEVEDTGTGMDSSTLSKIFDPFFTTKFTGRGLGLAAVLGIVRGHEGGLRIQTDQNSGTVFTVLLPRLPEGVGQHGNKTGTTKGTVKGLTVLIIDDEESVRNILGKMLESSGNQPLIASDGDSGLEILKSRLGDIDCILLDMTMPGKNGVETLAEIRAMSSDIPVVFSSGYPEETIRTKLKGLDVSGFVQKPLGMKSLFQALKDATSSNESS